MFNVDKEKETEMKKLLIVLLITVALVAQVNAAALKPALIEQIESAISTGDFRFDHPNGRIYINSYAYWYSVDLEQKENLCNMWAKYMEHSSGEPQNWIVVYDKHTGKKLGKWGAGELTVY